MNRHQLYVMTASGYDGIAHFKIGVTSNPAMRPLEVQTGCPFKISHVLFAQMPSKIAAYRAEKELHQKLEEYKSFGEWFTFDTTDAKHKADFNGRCKEVIGKYLGDRWKWQQFSVDSLRGVAKKDAEKDARIRSDFARSNRLKTAVGLKFGLNF